MVCTYTGTTSRSVRGKRRSSIWTTSRAALLLAVCLLVAGLLPSTVGAQSTCSTAISNNADLVSDCEALLASRDTLAGVGSLNWSADVAMGDWDGITLSGTPSRVTEIDLYSNGLKGSIPSDLGDLDKLEVLDLSSNDLSGSIPPELGNLTNLEDLELQYNDLSGSIPSELGNLTKLIWLYLDSNNLSGSIPSELGNLTKLKYLLLQYNDLSGSIPPELGNLTNLKWLRLENNDLSGPVPLEMGNLTNLSWLKLGGNALCVPAAYHDQFPFNRMNLPVCTGVELTISVSPSASVSHTDEVTLTVTASDPTQVASYRWAHVGGSQKLSTQPSVTLGGVGWPNSPGTRTFQAIVTLNDGSQGTAEQSITFTAPPPRNVSLSIAVFPATTVPHTEEVTLTANASDPAYVTSYHWAHVGGWHTLSRQQSVTLGGAMWPKSAGTRTFRATITLYDGSQVTAEQSIAFINPPPPPPPAGVSVSISVSPGTSVPHNEQVTLTAEVSGPAQVASYRWAHVGGWHRIGTQQSVTLGGTDWPHGPGTRTFQAIVTLSDGSQVIAEQSIAFTNP